MLHTKKNLILIVDKEPLTRKILSVILPEEHFTLEECTTGQQAVRLMLSLKPDIILLDLELPDTNGFDLITALREWSQTPIIIVTASSESADTVRALNLGADDYVIKPFNSSILEARINSNLRKAAIHEMGEPQIFNGLLRIDLVRHEVFMAEELVQLTPKEYNLLRFFMVNSGKMLTHRQILSSVWGAAHSDDVQYLRVFVGQIRAKLGKVAHKAPDITTEPGIGYRMERVVPAIKPIGNAALN